jgi:hypothetical protein
MALTERARGAGWRANILLMFVTLIICFSAGEVVARLLFNSHIGQDLGTTSPIILDAEWGWKTNPLFRFEGNQKSKDGSTYPVKVSFNGDGFRQFGDQASKRKKVLVIGDSFTMADQVSDDQTYFFLAGQKLDWEVFAYGCGGYQTLQEYQVLDRYVDIVKPDLIVWQFCFNDFVDNDVDLEAYSTRNNNGLVRPYWVNGKIEYLFPKPSWERFVRRAFGWSRLMGFLFNRIDKLRANDPDRSIETVLARDGFAHPGFARALKVTDELLGMVRKRVGRTPVIGLYVNGLRPAEDAPALAAFRGLCGKYEFTCVPSSDAVERAERQGVMVRHADKAHWNVTGHRLVADLLVNTVGKR